MPISRQPIFLEIRITGITPCLQSDAKTLCNHAVLALLQNELPATTLFGLNGSYYSL